MVERIDEKRDLEGGKKHEEDEDESDPAHGPKLTHRVLLRETSGRPFWVARERAGGRATARMGMIFAWISRRLSARTAPVLYL